jgi:hypothetical protein
MMAVSRTSSAKTPATHWYLDSGSSDHFSPYEQLFESLRYLPEPIEIDTAEGTAYGIAKGRIHLTVQSGDESTDIILNNVLYAPDMQSNLLSTTVLYDLGFEISMEPGVGTRIIQNGEVLAETIREGKLFRLAIPGPQSMAMAARTVQAEDVTVWHRRLAHMGEGDVRKMENLAEGVKIRGDSSFGNLWILSGGKATSPTVQGARIACGEGRGVDSHRYERSNLTYDTRRIQLLWIICRRRNSEMLSRPHEDERFSRDACASQTFRQETRNGTRCENQENSNRWGIRIQKVCGCISQGGRNSARNYGALPS